MKGRPFAVCAGRTRWPFEVRVAVRAALEWADEQAGGLLIPVALVGGALAGAAAANPRVAAAIARLLGSEG